MIIGIVLTILLLFLVPTVLKWMNVPNHDIYTPRNVFDKAGDVLNSIFRLGNTIQKSQLENQYRGNMYYDTTPELQQPLSEGYQL